MTIRRLIVLAVAAALSIGAGQAPRQLNWNNRVVLTPAGTHLVGNPAAPVKLVEYVSYTCSHCAHFEVEGEGPMHLAYVVPGKLSVEVRNFVRDPVDLTVAMLTNCGPVAKFPLNHAAFMRGQANWIGPMGSASDAQRARWTTGSDLARRRAIANDFRFYDIMQSRGYDRPAVDRCLADDAMARKLAALTDQAAQSGVNATPSFAINGLLLAGTHDWHVLEPQLRARM